MYMAGKCNVMNFYKMINLSLILKQRHLKTMLYNVYIAFLVYFLIFFIVLNSSGNAE